MFANQKKAIFITGTSSGIGKSTALELAACDYIVFAGVRNKTDAEEIKTIGGDNVIPVIIDITKQDQVQQAYETIQNHLHDNPLFALINNVGIFIPGPIETTTIPDWQTIFEINVFGHLRVIQTFLPLIRQSQGRIINISSVAGRISLPLMGAYSATKFAINAISDALRIELRKWNIKVITIEPQPVDTIGWEKFKVKTDQICQSQGEIIDTLYKEEFEFIYKGLEHKRLVQIDTPTVSSYIKKALNTKWPRSRYRVGPMAKFGAVFPKVIPPFVLDILFSKLIR